MGHGPPLAKKISFDHREKLGKPCFWPSLCVSISVHRKFGPLYEILNTPLLVGFVIFMLTQIRSFKELETRCRLSFICTVLCLYSSS